MPKSFLVMPISFLLSEDLPQAMQQTFFATNQITSNFGISMPAYSTSSRASCFRIVARIWQARSKQQRLKISLSTSRARLTLGKSNFRYAVAIRFIAAQFVEN